MLPLGRQINEKLPVPRGAFCFCERMVSGGFHSGSFQRFFAASSISAVILEIASLCPLVSILVI